mmetsp:Transcript_145142/g.404429  ORF Transcript_145142/g.404429 Transcript_145142/m.404429 type:complete len:263 (+) Transcript_145142:529-1317(+)
MLANSLLMLPQELCQVHVYKAIALGNGNALCGPARAARADDAEAVRAQGCVGERSDMQVVVDHVVHDVLVVVACADLYLPDNVLEQLRDGDDMPLVLLQPIVDEVLLLGSVKAGGSNLCSVALADGLLTRVQQEYLVKAEARLLQGQSLCLDLGPGVAVQDPTLALMFRELSLHLVDHDVIVHEDTCLDCCLELFSSPEQLANLDVLDFVVRGNLLAVLRAVDARWPDDANAERGPVAELFLQKLDWLLGLVDDDLPQQVCE